MKNKLTIKNVQGEYLQHVIFEDQETQDSFVEMLAATSAWGKAEHQVEILDEEGKSLDPKQYETIASEYSIEIEDVTVQLEQQKINEEARVYLASTDWMVLRMMDIGTPIPEGIQVLRQQARDRIL